MRAGMSMTTLFVIPARQVTYLAESIPVPQIIDPVFMKTSSKRSFSMTENERFGLVFANTGSTNSDTGLLKLLQIRAMFFLVRCLSEFYRKWPEDR
jgi:hypothetical protein